jgi:predicted membrane protein
MKMVSIFDGVFWGVVLIAVGVWFLVRRYVPVNIPVFRIIIAVIFVYIGIRVLIQGPAIRDRNTVVFTESTLPYTPASGHDYNVIFGSGTVDLTTAVVGQTGNHAQVNVIFGTGVLRLNPSLPIHVSMSSAFGTVEAPNGRSVAFGDSDYNTPSYKPGSPALDIKATAVFGRLVIEPTP